MCLSFGSDKTFLSLLALYSFVNAASILSMQKHRSVLKAGHDRLPCVDGRECRVILRHPAAVVGVQILLCVRPLRLPRELPRVLHSSSNCLGLSQPSVKLLPRVNLAEGRQVLHEVRSGVLHYFTRASERVQVSALQSSQQPR